MSLFSFLKKKKAPEETQVETKTLGQKLEKTGGRLREGLSNFFLGKKKIDDELLEELETLLLTADVGVKATQKVMDEITDKVSRKELNDEAALRQALKQALTQLLLPVEKPLTLNLEHQPAVILVVGINGSGKTTTIGKLSRKLLDEGKSVMLAAGDTFRAAAVEQLQTWGERNGVPVISQGEGADCASVLYDALESARARKTDVLIADTAGRLHTQIGLMDELKKVLRVMKKLDPSAPHEVLIVLDGCTGQNALNQARQFHQSLGLTGLAITKLDGTAKGGILFSIAEELSIPVRFIGVGEKVEDLQVFEAERFVDALLGDTHTENA